MFFTKILKFYGSILAAGLHLGREVPKKPNLRNGCRGLQLPDLC
jgi:hypothetical protein